MAAEILIRRNQDGTPNTLYWLKPDGTVLITFMADNEDIDPAGLISYFKTDEKWVNHYLKQDHPLSSRFGGSYSQIEAWPGDDKDSYDQVLSDMQKIGRTRTVVVPG